MRYPSPFCGRVEKQRVICLASAEDRGLANTMRKKVKITGVKCMIVRATRTETWRGKRNDA
jgi:hypothetical protein